jgi:DNA damage-binding protein 1
MIKIIEISLIMKLDVIPRSIIIETLEQISYLFISLGDGSVISYVIDKASNCELRERRKVVLGTQPTILKKFHSEKPVQTSNIFACSDRPSVISSTNQKLVYSSVNLKQVEYMCQLNSRSYQNSLALLSSGVLRIGTMDSIQKLHIRSVHLNETARRIAYQAETQSFGVLTLRMDLVSSKSGYQKPLVPSASTQCSSQFLAKSGSLIAIENQNQGQEALPGPSSSSESNTLGSYVHFETQSVNSFLILDQNTFEVLHSVQFMPNEFATSILSTSFYDSNNEQSSNNGGGGHYFVIGSSIVNDDEPEPKQGRLIVLKYHENKLVHVCEKELRGSPYNLVNFNGKLLVSVSNSLKLYEFKENQLNQIASQSDQVFITHLKCKNDFILVGDMMKSCQVYTFKPETSQFETVAKDYSPIWLSSIEILDDDTFLMGDSLNNLVLLKKDSGHSNEEDRKTLQNSGCTHLGEQVNVFRHGSLVMQEQQSSNELLTNQVQGSVLAGTVSGAIILFTQLSEVLYKILNELQMRLGAFLVTAGKIEYNKWRHFETEKRVESSKGFIDGDLIESFLELTQNEAQNLIQGFKVFLNFYFLTC